MQPLSGRLLFTDCAPRTGYPSTSKFEPPRSRAIEFLVDFPCVVIFATIGVSIILSIGLVASIDAVRDNAPENQDKVHPPPPPTGRRGRQYPRPHLGRARAVALALSPVRLFVTPRETNLAQSATLDVAARLSVVGPPAVQDLGATLLNVLENLFSEAFSENVTNGYDPAARVGQDHDA